MRTSAKQRVLTLASAAVAAFILCGSASAQYEGPGKAEVQGSVADVLLKPVKGQWVQIEGRLSRRLGQGRFIFTDGTGDVRVAIPAALLQGKEIDESSMVRIRGRTELDFNSTPEINVRELEVITS